jgi:hypothetical protein
MSAKAEFESELNDWCRRVIEVLELNSSTKVDISAILELTKDVAHGVARPAAPLTAYLLGLRDGLDQQNQTALRISQIQGLIDNSG